MIQTHLIEINQLDIASLTHLLDRAEYWLHNTVISRQINSLLHGCVVANLFFEPSTRTQYSFTVAAERLGAIVLNPQLSHSSLVKGESLLDTARTFVAMGAEILVVRHSAPDIMEELVTYLGERTAIINAGAGSKQHPTQGLLDLLTIRQQKTLGPGLAVAVIGDVLHSRVARSLIDGLCCVGVNDIRVVAPEEWLPSAADLAIWQVVQPHAELRSALTGADVVVALRIQTERMQAADQVDKIAFYKTYGLTEQTLRYAKPDAMVLHPGPMIRGVEIASIVADGQQSYITEQVRCGVAARMAVLEWCHLPP